MKRGIWWVVVAIVVWLGLAEGLPVLWDAGGRDAWAWLSDRGMGNLRKRWPWLVGYAVLLCAIYAVQAIFHKLDLIVRRQDWIMRQMGFDD